MLLICLACVSACVGHYGQMLIYGEPEVMLFLSVHTKITSPSCCAAGMRLHVNLVGNFCKKLLHHSVGHTHWLYAVASSPRRSAVAAFLTATVSCRSFMWLDFIARCCLVWAWVSALLCCRQDLLCSAVAAAAASFAGARSPICLQPKQQTDVF